MPSKLWKNKGRGQSVIEPEEKTKEKEKENYKDAKDHKEMKDPKDIKDWEAKSQKEIEKGFKDLKDFDVKPFKEKDFKDVGEIKIKESDKWTGEGLPVGLGGPVEGGITIAQLARRVANLEAIVARGEAFIQPKQRPEVGVKAKKRGG